MEIDLVAEMMIINPFDFFLNRMNETFPFTYETDTEGGSCALSGNESAAKKLNDLYGRDRHPPRQTIDFLVAMNQQLSSEIAI